MAAIRISADEQARLDACSLEPIRTPGSVQAHGVLLAVDADTLEVRHVSDSATALLGLDAPGILGRTLEEVVGPVAREQVLQVLDPAVSAANPAFVTIGGRQFDAIVHPDGDLVLIDLEPTLQQHRSGSTAVLYSEIHDLARIRTAKELWSATARAVRTITQFDHVMVYRFYDDDHGEIVGEELAEGMQPYLGLHYPASDIPQQARELYLSKLSRVIATTDQEPSALLSAARPGEPSHERLDLSLSELRSVSPHHLQFMRNMGQASTMSFSLVTDGRLIGLIACAHRTPRRLSYALRQGIEILANQVALQLSSIASIEMLTRRVEIRTVRGRLIAALTGEVDIAAGLLDGPVTITDFIPADGVVIRLGGVTTTRGHVPSACELTEVIAAIRSHAGPGVFVTDALPVEHPELSALAPSAVGMLVVPIGGEGDYIAWFRDELVRSIEWLGDQTLANRETPLSPRNSFSSWSQDVTGTAAAWAGLEIDAVEFGLDLESALFRRAESRLAQVAMHDPLTGLPNRRLMMDRLDQSLARSALGAELCVLFVDLDHFKAVNDAFGHAAGDEVLMRTARRLLTAVRGEDTVARIGGDEFVIICEDLSVEQAKVVADRILAAIREPGASDRPGQSPMTASIGIACADPGFDASDLLVLADAAMYRAKAAGRDRHSE